MKIATQDHWFIRYKLYHIPFWCLYHFIWWTVSIGSPGGALYTILFSPYLAKFLSYVLFQAIGVYFNLYFLIPRFLEKGKVLPYTIFLGLTVFFTAVFTVSGYYIGAWISEKTFQELYQVEPSNCTYFLYSNALPSAVASTTLAMSIKLTKNWIQSQRHQQLLEKEKLETELKFLRSQFNPHFLFNTINSIFFLIHKNPTQASSSLAQFSDLLRYQLYECNEKMISLHNEIIYIENFIALEKLRLNEEVLVEVHLDSQPKQHLAIAPFILMTFVENAFKHVSHLQGQPNWIKITLQLEDKQLYFTVSNSISEEPSSEVVRYGGIGLQNIKRRLELIYHDRYHLDIQHDASRFKVVLQLELHETVLVGSIEKFA